MLGTTEIRELLDAGGTVRGSDGEKIGKIGDVYLDNAEGKPAWVTVRTGLLGTGQRFVPIDDATIEDGALHVPFDKLTVLAAPSVEADALLGPEDEIELYDHYAVPVSAPDPAPAPADLPADGSRAG